MKKIILIPIFILSTFNIIKSYDDVLYNLFIFSPSIISCYFGYKGTQHAQELYEIAEEVRKDPKKNFSKIEDFCANYKQIISSGKTYISVHDTSLALTLINLKETSKLNDFVKYITKLMENKADDIYSTSLQIPIIIFIFNIFFHQLMNC